MIGVNSQIATGTQLGRGGQRRHRLRDPVVDRQAVPGGRQGGQGRAAAAADAAGPDAAAAGGGPADRPVRRRPGGPAAGGIRSRSTRRRSIRSRSTPTAARPIRSAISSRPRRSSRPTLRRDRRLTRATPEDRAGRSSGARLWQDRVVPTPRPFAQVDVFTDEPYRGNPVAVVLDGRRARRRRDAARRELDQPVRDDVRPAADGRRSRLPRADLHAGGRAAVRRPPDARHVPRLARGRRRAAGRRRDRPAVRRRARPVRRRGRAAAFAAPAAAPLRPGRGGR